MTSRTCRITSWHWVAVLVALVGALPTPTPVSASPQDVVNAFRAGDTLLESQSDPADLLGAIALVEVQLPGDRAQFAASVTARVRDVIWGITPSTQDDAGPDIPRADLPVWMIVAAAGAGLLLASGLGASVWRRTRRPLPSD